MKRFSFKSAASAAVLLLLFNGTPLFGQWAVVDAGAIANLGKQIGLTQTQIAQMAKDLQIAAQGLAVMQDSYAAMQYLNSGMAIKNTFLSAGPAFIGARYGNQWGETAQWGLAMNGRPQIVRRLDQLGGATITASESGNRSKLQKHVSANRTRRCFRWPWPGRFRCLRLVDDEGRAGNLGASEARAKTAVG